ncbi:hypothetical protein RM543_05950 [Roseicyclus sp. F158]|uniref:Glycosyltransferase family 2 protein n=1 Tax=Tropicimonas omnivorans TaxID=3075590 RepID=A0ABU3DET3_9RHOB|nr:hypothetical protein [Roseicyclus sp. F158]MDT0682219.1 hypothetical protein [Roseicyclus sp. F158]
MTGAAFSLHRLNALSLAGSGLARRDAVAPAAQGEGFAAAYDRETLWYDALTVGRETWLICPKLLNLSPLLKTLELDGTPVRLKGIQRHRRYDIARLGQTGRRLSVSHEGWHADCAVGPLQTDAFEGLDASVHISRNNRLEWIADWARFHVAEQGLEAMLVIDNGSDDYPPEAILDTMERAGLKAGAVLLAPQPYGPVRARRGGGGAKFLQPAMLNLARIRFLARARAVLSADLDELVWTEGKSIFDHAAAARTGWAMVEGRWRMPPDGAAAPLRHADHTHLRKGDPACPPKWCARPGAVLSRRGWEVHGPEMPLPARWLTVPDGGYWHCRAVTTNWKDYDRLNTRHIGPFDRATAEKLALRLP